MNVPAGQQTVSDWLATDEGHAWLDAHNRPRTTERRVLGMNGQPWISLKEERLSLTGPLSSYVAAWFPADPERRLPYGEDAA